MDFSGVLNKAIRMGLEGFKAFIKKKINSNTDYLKQFFWLQKDGSQQTVLNHLIDLHQEPQGNDESYDAQNNLTELIDYIVDLSDDKNVGEPLHQATVAGKLRLVSHLLETEQGILEQNAHSKAFSNKYDVDRRDREARTLISLVLNTKNTSLLIKILARNPNVHAATAMTDARVMFQPIHQAVVLDFADGIRLLGNHGAQLANPLGKKKDTPLILAARRGKIDALEALLEFPIEKLSLEAENNKLFDAEESNSVYYKKQGHTAMEELCERMIKNKDHDNAIRGIAMLLCRGAEPPAREEMCDLLSTNRIELLKAIHHYLEDKPELVDPFVNRCHLRGTDLHNIVYADHSWGSSIRHLFGIPSESAFIVESLITRKYDSPQANIPDMMPLASSRADVLSKETNHLKLYAEFVRRYTQAYDSQLFTNRWSTMRWMIAEGNCDWRTVVEYARNHPTSRTRIIWGEMFHPMPRIHEEMEEAESDNSLKQYTV